MDLVLTLLSTQSRDVSQTPSGSLPATLPVLPVRRHLIRCQLLSTTPGDLPARGKFMALCAYPHDDPALGPLWMLTDPKYDVGVESLGPLPTLLASFLSSHVVLVMDARHRHALLDYERRSWRPLLDGSLIAPLLGATPIPPGTLVARADALAASWRAEEDEAAEVKLTLQPKNPRLRAGKKRRRSSEEPKELKVPTDPAAIKERNKATLKRLMTLALKQAHVLPASSEYMAFYMRVRAGVLFDLRKEMTTKVLSDRTILSKVEDHLQSLLNGQK